MNTKISIVTSILSLGLAGCASYTEYPILPQTLEADEGLSCNALDYELDQADQLRDRIIKEQGDVISDAVSDTAIDAVFNPVNAAVSGVMKSVGVSGATKHYTEAAAAAGNRMEQLLKYKRTKDCDSGITREWGTTDEELLARLEDLQLEYEAGNVGAKDYLERRAVILSTVRY